MARVAQVVRVLALVQALSSTRRGITVAGFSASKGWAPRTVYNDLKRIEEAGFPLTKVDGRYRFAEGWRPPPQAGLDRDEALALFLARELFGGARATSMGQALDRLRTKLCGEGPVRGSEPDGAAGLSIRGPSSIDYRAHQTTLDAIERAIEDRTVLRCRFVRSGTGEITRREIEPGELHLDLALETYYLIAWCRLRQAVRVFAVHRMSEVERTAETFTRRPETRSKVALKNAFRIWRSENVRRVRLRFDSRAAAEIRERTWHSSQKLEDLPGGDVRLTMEIAHPRELERWLLGFGDRVRVEEPAAFGRRLAEIHRKAAEVVGVPSAAGKPAAPRKSAGSWQTGHGN